MTSLLLDEMFSVAIAEQLRAKGHDVIAVVTDPALVGLSDDQILAHATDTGRALVTANIKDFVPLDARYRAASQTHAGLILVSTKTFPQDRTFTAAITSALSALLGKAGQIHPGQVLWSIPGFVHTWFCVTQLRQVGSAVMRLPRAGGLAPRAWRGRPLA